MSEKALGFNEAYKAMLKARIPYEVVLRTMMEQSCVAIDLINYLVSMGLLEDFFDKHEGIKDMIELLRQGVKKIRVEE